MKKSVFLLSGFGGLPPPPLSGPTTFFFFLMCDFPYGVSPYRGIHEKGSDDVVSAVCCTIYNIYLSLCTQTADTTSSEPFSWIPLYFLWLFCRIKHFLFLYILFMVLQFPSMFPSKNCKFAQKVVNININDSSWKYSNILSRRIFNETFTKNFYTLRY